MKVKKVEVVILVSTVCKWQSLVKNSTQLSFTRRVSGVLLVCFGRVCYIT